MAVGPKNVNKPQESGAKDDGVVLGIRAKGVYELGFRIAVTRVRVLAEDRENEPGSRELIHQAGRRTGTREEGHTKSGQR
jgi:hypothetical protein